VWAITTTRAELLNHSLVFDFGARPPLYWPNFVLPSSCGTQTKPLKFLGIATDTWGSGTLPASLSFAFFEQTRVRDPDYPSRGGSCDCGGAVDSRPTPLVSRIRAARE
jgi:hypothetical protein